MLLFHITFIYKGLTSVIHVSKVETPDKPSSYFVEVEDHDKFNIPESILLQHDHYNRLVFYYAYSDKKFVREIAKQVILYCHNNNIPLQ